MLLHGFSGFPFALKKVNSRLGDLVSDHTIVGLEIDSQAKSPAAWIPHSGVHFFAGLRCI